MSREEIIADFNKENPHYPPQMVTGVRYFSGGGIFSAFNKDVLRDISFNQYSERDGKQHCTEIKSRADGQWLRQHGIAILGFGLKHDGFFSALLYILAKPLLNFIQWRDIRHNNLHWKEHLYYLTPLGMLKYDINWGRLKTLLKGKNNAK